MRRNVSAGVSTTWVGSVVYARTITEPGQLAELIRREVQNVNPDIPVYGVRTLDDVVAQSLAQRRFALELLGIFAEWQ